MDLSRITQESVNAVIHFLTWVKNMQYKDFLNIWPEEVNRMKYIRKITHCYRIGHMDTLMEHL